MGRFIIACGGTGGHLFPGIAVAEEMVRRGHEVRLHISSKAVDRHVASLHPEFTYTELPAIGWPGMGWRAGQFFQRLWASYRQCVREFVESMPHAVVGMGGFVSAGPLFAARRLGLPCYLHESNAFPGRVTRMMGRGVSSVCLGFGECAEHLKDSRCVVTGTPVRGRLRKLRKAAAVQLLGLDPEKKTLGVMGGSQGASSLNRLMTHVVPLLEEDWKRWQVVHLTGEQDEMRVRHEYESRGVHCAVFSFQEEMDLFYSAVDLLVARAGASSMTEIAFYKLPSILVPYPFAADGHQDLNAEVFVKKNAARRVREDRNGVKNLARELHSLMADDAVRKEMGEMAGKAVVDRAAARIVEEVERGLV